MWCDVIWCDVIWCDVMWCDVIWCDVMWSDVIWCDVMWSDVMWCDLMWCDLMWCDVIWSDVMWCDAGRHASHAAPPARLHHIIDITSHDTRGIGIGARSMHCAGQDAKSEGRGLKERGGGRRGGVGRAWHLTHSPPWQQNLNKALSSGIWVLVLPRYYRSHPPISVQYCPIVPKQQQLSYCLSSLKCKLNPK